MLIDLDQFKEVNDTLGHDIGDILLQEAARRILSCVRETDTVARLGGDEFTVVLSQLSNASHAENIAQKIIKKLSEPFKLNEEVAHISASLGITLYPADALDIDSMMRNADQAMYVAKNNGRNRYSHFTASLQETAQKRLRLTNDLRSALAGQQFRLYFQPIVDLNTNRIHKAEALLRWQHPLRGMVSPADFIPLAEETHLIVEIGVWIRREALIWCERWNKHNPDGFQISINKSPVEFMDDSDSDRVESFVKDLSEKGLSGKNFVFEITEGLLLNADPRINTKLMALRDAGIQVSIDDFGTGYSSLSYLKKFDIDYLKIDQSFVRNLERDTDDMAL
jgi:diguanylate cyclase (GGDEF)-like protein